MAVRLNATDDPGYVQEWIESHPGGEVLVTEEIADRLDLPRTGLTKQGLSTDVETLVDKLVEHADDPVRWDDVPAISTAPTAVVIWALGQRYQRGEISLDRFRTLAALATGWKVTKIAALSALMAIPSIDRAVGAALVAKLLLSVRAGGQAAERSAASLQG